MRISDWSSDVCSSDLGDATIGLGDAGDLAVLDDGDAVLPRRLGQGVGDVGGIGLAVLGQEDAAGDAVEVQQRVHARSEEHTSELQSLMRISYAVFCLKKKKNKKTNKRKK